MQLAVGGLLANLRQAVTCACHRLLGCHHLGLTAANVAAGIDDLPSPDDQHFFGFGSDRDFSSDIHYDLRFLCPSYAACYNRR